MQFLRRYLDWCNVMPEEQAHPAEDLLPAVWSTRDPRERINKRARIIVVAGDRVMFATVETKHGYSVFLEPREPDWRQYVGDDEKWPGWFWSPAPRRT